MNRRKYRRTRRESTYRIYAHLFDLGLYRLWLPAALLSLTLLSKRKHSQGEVRAGAEHRIYRRFVVVGNHVGNFEHNGGK